jgi:hypothetical protein
MILLVAAALALAPPQLDFMPYPYPVPQSAPAQSSTQTLEPSSSVQSADSVNLTPGSTATGLLVVALTLSLLLGAFGYKKYRTAQRSRLLKRQVAMLEAMWRMSSTKRKF